MTAAGYRQMLRWLRSVGDLTVVGIEGTGSYGVGLTRFLLEAGVELRAGVAAESAGPTAQRQDRRGGCDRGGPRRAQRRGLRPGRRGLSVDVCLV